MLDPRHLSKKAQVILGVSSVVFILSGFFAYRYFVPSVSSFAECEKARGSHVLLIHPGICITRNGDQFFEEIELTEQSVLEAPDASVCEFTECVVAIQNNKCCPCPAKVPSGLVGRGGWEIYDGSYSVGSYEPDYCSRYRHLTGDCPVCPDL